MWIVAHGAVVALMGGQVPSMVVDTASGLPMMKAGRLRPLAVFSRSRLPALPEVPSLIELGYTDVEAFAWQGMVVPAATPKEVVARLSTELQKAIATPAVRAKLTEIGLELIPSEPQGLSAHLAAETKVWQKLIRDRNITLD